MRDEVGRAAGLLAASAAFAEQAVVAGASAGAVACESAVVDHAVETWRRVIVAVAKAGHGN